MRSVEMVARLMVGMGWALSLAWRVQAVLRRGLVKGVQDMEAFRQELMALGIQEAWEAI
jgi:hypothetical protein